MPLYEMVLVVSGRLQRAELGQFLRLSAQEVMRTGATLARIAALGANGFGPRKLAYPVRRSRAIHYLGYYLQLGVFGSPEMVREIDRRLLNDERLLRRIIVKRRPDQWNDEVYDLDEGLPEAEVSKEDPLFELKRFMKEYAKEHPQGQTIDIAARIRKAQQIGVQNVLRNIRGAPPSPPPPRTSGPSSSADADPPKENTSGDEEPTAQSFLNLLGLDSTKAASQRRSDTSNTSATEQQSSKGGDENATRRPPADTPPTGDDDSSARR